jgi:transcription elongation factor SPT5
VLPSIKDPSLFLIKLRRGVDEREALRALLMEYQLREDGKDESRKLQILSAFTTPASRGCIYVEAYREAHLKSALQSVPLGRAYYSYYAQSSTNIKVPISEMVAALKFRSEERTVSEGQWVRMKRGPFKDDLARVVRLQDQGALITIKLMPRINYLFLEAKRHDDKLSAAEWARSRPQDAARRPPQKLFDRDEVSALGFGKMIETKRGTTHLDKDSMYRTFMNMRFKGGFLYKDVKLDALVRGLSNDGALAL